MLERGRKEQESTFPIVHGETRKQQTEIYCPDDYRQSVFFNY